MSTNKPLRLAPYLVLGGLLVGCGGGGGAGGASGFQLTQMSLQDRAVWEVNREITFTFNSAVDFSTVSLTTIQIVGTVPSEDPDQPPHHPPATGKFSLRGTNVVVFQPNCPTREDFSDAGLMAGGIDYKITVIGRDGNTLNTVRSDTGKVLEISQIRSFSTPASNQASTVFLDTTLGPPVPVVRSPGSTDPNATCDTLKGAPTRLVGGTLA